jgi:cation channel sperm-associated protein 3
MNLVWFEAFIFGLHYHENAMFKCQQAHFAIAYSLAEVVDGRLQNKD